MATGERPGRFLTPPAAEFISGDMGVADNPVVFSLHASKLCLQDCPLVGHQMYEELCASQQWMLNGPRLHMRPPQKLIAIKSQYYM